MSKTAKPSFARRYRTAFLAILATGILVWGCIYIFEVPVSEFMQMLLAAVLGMFVIVAAAAIAGFLLAKLRSKL